MASIIEIGNKIARADAAQRPRSLHPHLCCQDAGPPEMRAVDAALTAWQQAQTGAAKTRAVQNWMRGMERIEQPGGNVAVANAHSRKALGGRYAGFIREVAALAKQRGMGMECD